MDRLQLARDCYEAEALSRTRPAEVYFGWDVA